MIVCVNTVFIEELALAENHSISRNQRIDLFLDIQFEFFFDYMKCHSRVWKTVEDINESNIM